MCPEEVYHEKHLGKQHKTSLQIVDIFFTCIFLFAVATLVHGFLLAPLLKLVVLLGAGVDKGGLGVLVLVLLAENGLFTTCEERTKQLTAEDQLDEILFTLTNLNSYPTCALTNLNFWCNAFQTSC